MKEDVIYRQNAIDVICLSWCGCKNSDCKHHFDPEVDESYWCDGCGDVEELKNIPSAEPELDEWCTDCKEYDQERHCCPRWNRVIRETLKDAENKIVRCKDCKYCAMIGEDDYMCKNPKSYVVATEPTFGCILAKRREDESVES